MWQSEGHLLLILTNNNNVYAFMALQKNLQHWLTDSKARDQFVIRAGEHTEVLWNDARHMKPDPVYTRRVCINLFLSYFLYTLFTNRCQHVSFHNLSSCFEA